MATPDRQAAATDDDLLAQARAGSDTAVATLTRRHNQRLYRIARGILRDDAEAEDVVQETYVRAFTALAEFRGASSLTTWLVRIAMNEALGRLRHRRPTIEYVPETEGQVRSRVVPFRGAAAPAPDPEARALGREVSAILERSIARLPDALRAVFVARIIEGLSVDDTAELLGLRPETVKTRTHRARRRLQQDLRRQLGAGLEDLYRFDGDRCERLTARVLARLASRRLDREPAAPSSI